MTTRLLTLRDVTAMTALVTSSNGASPVRKYGSQQRP